jgi:AcrR family transcriptional regulator
VLPDSCFEPGSERQAKFPAASESCRIRRAVHDHRRLHLAKPVSIADAANFPDCAGAIIACTHEQGVGQRRQLTLGLVEGAIEKILECAGHVTEVFRRAKHEPVSPSQIVGPSRPRESCTHQHPGDRRVACALIDRLRKLARVAGLGVMHDQEMLHRQGGRKHDDGVMVRSISGAPQERIKGSLGYDRRMASENAVSSAASTEAPVRAYHHGDLRETLMEAALASIAAHGTEKLSLRALAREAGVSPTAPYRHFSSKESLLAAIAEAGYAQLLGRFELVVAAAHGDLESRLLAIGMAYLEFALEHPARYELMFGSVLADFSGYASLQEAGQRCYRVLYQVLEDGLEHADGSDLTATRLGGVVWAAVHGVASLMLYHRALHPTDDAGFVGASLWQMQSDPARALRTLFAGMR